jgi:hypothetical protein
MYQSCETGHAGLELLTLAPLQAEEQERIPGILYLQEIQTRRYRCNVCGSLALR